MVYRMEELISVIVPVYNTEQYLERCIDSILRQSYRNFELILIDDGSTDGSRALCEQAQSADSRIVLLTQENSGASAARNAGLRAAKGQYIVFVDSDDFVASSYLADLHAAAKSRDFDIVQCSLVHTNEKTLNALQIPARKTAREITKEQALNRRLYKVSVCGKIYSAALLNGFQFREGNIYEDDASYYVFIANASRIALLDEPLYYYYMSENSVMRNDKADKSLVFLDIYQERIDFFKKREEPMFVEGTYGRLCLVLMAFIARSKSQGTNKGDIKALTQQFNHYYRLTMRSRYVSIKDKLMFTMFRIMPNTVSFLLKGRWK